MLQLLAACCLMAGVVGTLLSLPVVNRQADQIVARGYFEDFGGHEDIDSIRERPFTPFTGPLFLGNQSRSLWLKLTVAPSAHADRVVIYQPNHLHRVETWLPGADGRWRHQVAGSREAFSQSPLALLSPAAVVPAGPAAVTIYARVQSPTTPVHAMVISLHDSRQLDTFMHLLAGVFAGMGLILAMISFMVFLGTRDPLWGLDSLMNLGGLVMLSLMLGLASKFVWPDRADWVNQLTLIGISVYTALVSLFYARLLRIFELRRWLGWPYWLALVLFPLQISWIQGGQADMAMSLNNGLIMTQALWGLVILVKVRHRDRWLVLAFRLGYAGLLGYLLWWGVAMVLRQQTGNFSTLYPMLPTSLFSMLLMLLILARHTQLRLQAAQRLALEKREAEQRLLYERRRHEETNSFLGMVLHEVKSPLNYIRMAASNLQTELSGQDEPVRRRLRRIHESVDNIDEVLERSMEVDSLEQGGLVLAPATVNVAALVAEQLAAHPDSPRIKAALPAALIARVDSHLLGLMLRNLLDNALKYAPAGADVTVTLGRADQRWMIEVRNLVGQTGFPDPERVFSKYYRSPLAMARSGMGLGLYWVRGVALRMDGDIRYVREGDDVVFRLCLPI